MPGPASPSRSAGPGLLLPSRKVDSCAEMAPGLAAQRRGWLKQTLTPGRGVSGLGGTPGGPMAHLSGSGWWTERKAQGSQKNKITEIQNWKGPWGSSTPTPCLSGRPGSISDKWLSLKSAAQVSADLTDIQGGRCSRCLASSELLLPHPTPPQSGFLPANVIWSKAAIQPE